MAEAERGEAEGKEERKVEGNVQVLDLGHDLLVNVMARLDASGACAAAKACPAMLRAATDRRIAEEQQLHWCSSARLRGAVAAVASEALRVPPQIFAHRVSIDLESSFPIELKVDRLSELVGQTAASAATCGGTTAAATKSSDGAATGKLDSWLMSLIANPAEELLAREAAAARSEGGADIASRLCVSSLQAKEQPHRVECARADRGGVRLRLNPSWQVGVCKNPMSAQSLPLQCKLLSSSAEDEGMQECTFPETFASLRQHALERAMRSLQRFSIDSAKGCLVDCGQPVRRLPIGKGMSCVSFEGLVQAAQVAAMGRGVAESVPEAERTVLELAAMAVPRRMDCFWPSYARASRDASMAARILALHERALREASGSERAEEVKEEVYTHVEAEVSLRIDLMREQIALALREVDPQPIIIALGRLASAGERVPRLRHRQAVALAQVLVACFRVIGMSKLASE